MAKDYYKILGVDKGAPKEEIKKAYKKLAKQYHPDISKEVNADAKFKEINEAASVLLDDEKKQKYDTYGSSDGPHGFGGGYGGGGAGFDPRDFGINIDDIFEQFGFGGGFGARGGKQKKETRIYEEIEITLEDVYFGTKQEVKITRNVKCDDCNGKGAKKHSDVDVCPICNGKGVVIETQRSILGHIRTQRQCPECGGSGEVIKNPCKSCSGKGSSSKKETIEIKIPKGIENEVTLRVAGKGNYEKEHDSYGELYLKIYIKKHSQFDVDGSDLYMELEINFISAILGDEIEFDHFGKTLSLKIPAGTQPGTILRLKGKGMPYFNYNGNGDLYVKVKVEIPKKTTKEQNKILMDYANTMKDKSFIDRLKGLFN